jgi:hypothetical protein
MAGCSLISPKESRYLRAAQDHASQADIRQHFGDPDGTERTTTGESLWRYDIYEVEGGSQQSWAAMGSWCDRYMLSFDSRGILRHWTHTSYAHGGENMPIACDAGNEKQAL